MRTLSVATWCLLFVLAIGALPQRLAAADRVALVIGNSAYVNTPRLENPRNDAADFAATLQKLDFEVIQERDLDKATMDRALGTFAQALSGARIGLFFYAGHGMQVSGKNFLIPIDAKLTTEDGLDFEMVQLDIVQRAMERRASSSIIILDACRDNPLSRSLARALGTRSAAVGRGLAAMVSAQGTLISFSTQPGNVALDGVGRNSPFTTALLHRIAEPGEDLPSILINVRNDVISATGRRQVPWEHSALTAKIYFTPPKPPGPTAEQQVEMEFWSSVKESTSPAVLATYLERYPDGEFASIARALVAQYEQQLKANIAAREEERKREEEARKAAEVERLENERRAREAALAEESLRAKQASNDAEARRLDDQQRAEWAARSEELRKAAEEVRILRDAAKAAEEQRVAAAKAADAAIRAAREATARKQDADKSTEAVEVAALPKSRPAPFDGIWKLNIKQTNCAYSKRWSFLLDVKNGVIAGTIGNSRKITGTVSASGRVKFSHMGADANRKPDGKRLSYSGTLRGDSGSGTFYKGPRCSGSFTVTRY